MSDVSINSAWLDRTGLRRESPGSKIGEEPEHDCGLAKHNSFQLREMQLVLIIHGIEYEIKTYY
jgi:hypothetical protein